VPRLYPLLLASSFVVLGLALVVPSKTSHPASLLNSRDKSCLRFYDLNRLCVPLPNTDHQVIEVGPTEPCSDGFFQVQDVDVRKLFDDTLLLKETGDPLNEKPVLALFLGQGRALLLDAGNNSLKVEEVVAPLLAGRSVELLNTHLHGDHIGRNDHFDVIAIETPEVDAHCDIEERDFDENQAAACKNSQRYTPPEEQVLFSPRSFSVVRVVRDGHQLALGNGRVITLRATPGHSRTSLTLYDPTHRLLFTGDSLYPGSNPPLVHPNTGSSFGAYLLTAALYASMASEVDLVIGAHGEGLMPSRSLEDLFALVKARFDDPNNSADFIDDASQCPAGDFVMGNDPARP
jgi:glyoxylase-like metal-dependent hydrolase (beta-lactamase superfamily II)